jgi:hypothetical protein
MRPVLPATILAMVAASLVSCSGSPGRSGDTEADGEAPTTVWRSDGYGKVISISNGTARTFETTSISCMPGQPLDQLGQPASDGTVQYGREGVAEQTVRPAPDGGATLHVLGTAADIDLLPLPALPDSCEQKTPDDPVTTFDVFWTTFAEHYNSFTRKNINWAAVRDQYRPRVSADTEPEELYAVLEEMIRPLGDMHTSISGDDGEFEGARPGTRDLSSRAITTAVDNHLRQNLGVTAIQTFADGNIAYADLPSARGYLRVSSFDEYNEDDSSYRGNKAELDRALAAVFTPERVAAWRGLVIDVRNNPGGDDALALQVAGRLTDTPHLAYTKQARNDPADPNKHSRPLRVTVTPAEGPRYTGPVRVLTSDLTVSAGETFVESLMSRTPAPSRIGTVTQGVFADVLDRKLPNGWTFGLGNEEYYAPDGRNYEGVGIPPTVPTPVFTESEFAQRRDSALDAALGAPW